MKDDKLIKDNVIGTSKTLPTPTTSPFKSKGGEKINQYPTLVQFEKWMTEYKRLQGLEDKANEGLKGLYEDLNGCFLGYHNDLIGSLLKALMNDEYDWISWYIWEKDWGEKKDLKCYDKNKKELKSTTLKDLYNLITN